MGSLATSLTLSLALLVGCGSDTLPPPSDTAPQIPAQNDPSYPFTGARSWSLVGNPVDAGDPNFDLKVAAPSGTEFIDVWLMEAGSAIAKPGQRLNKVDGGFEGSIDLSALLPGEYELLMSADGESMAFALHAFKRSHPIYVVVTTDWDDSDSTDMSLAIQEDLHTEHPELLLTHLVGPYTFTDPAVSEDRRDLLVAWLLKMQSTYQDEIGLHIHPYCNFVTQVGPILDIGETPCRTDQSTVYGSDATGYTIEVSSYTVEEFTNQLLASNKLFMERGLGKPTSFRAGGWTAEINTLQSLEAAGYVVDTSANNWARMEEWIPSNQFGPTLYPWNMEHWASINDTSQPYYPSASDILVSGADSLEILEVPDNGILADYVTPDEMIEIFAANWDGGVLSEPRNFSIGYHPAPVLNPLYKERISDALTHVDQFLASQDKGPVRYGRLSGMAKIWTK